MNSGPMPQGKQIQQKQRHKHNIQTAVITQFKSPTLNSVCDIYRNRNITTKQQQQQQQQQVLLILSFLPCELTYFCFFTINTNKFRSLSPPLSRGVVTGTSAGWHEDTIRPTDRNPVLCCHRVSTVWFHFSCSRLSCYCCCCCC